MRSTKEVKIEWRLPQKRGLELSNLLSGYSLGTKTKKELEVFISYLKRDFGKEVYRNYKKIYEEIKKYDDRLC